MSHLHHVNSVHDAVTWFLVVYPVERLHHLLKSLIKYHFHFEYGKQTLRSLQSFDVPISESTTGVYSGLVLPLSSCDDLFERFIITLTNNNISNIISIAQAG